MEPEVWTPYGMRAMEAAQLAAIVESSEDAIIAETFDGLVLTWNAAAERMYGYRAEEMVGHPSMTVVPDDKEEELAIALESISEGRRIDHWETRRLRRDGSVFDASISMAPISDSQGRVVGISSITRDITQRKRDEAALARSEARKTAIVESSIDGIILMDSDGKVVEFNAAAERMFGFSREEVLGRRLEESIIPVDLQEGHTMGLKRFKESGSQVILGRHLEMRGRRRDGVEFPIEITITQARGEPLFVGTLRDISDRKRTEEELAYLAYHDPLTGLANRAMFDEQLDAALARARRHGTSVAVLYTDMDDFKLVNDGWGHFAGDRLLREVAHRLRAAARETDVVARLGGDEFLFLVPDIETDPRPGAPGPVEVAMAVANRVHEVMREPFIVEGSEVFLTTSIGVSVFPINASDGKELLSRADSAMYRGKQRGPATTTGGPDYMVDGKGRAEMGARLRRAVENDSLALLYQPIVDLSSGRVVGAEALLRWPSDDTELLPGDFLPLAMQAGLMDAITDWVLDRACAQARRWHQAGFSLFVTMNLSPAELGREGLAEMVATKIGRAGLEPSDLVLEITEAAVMATEPDKDIEVAGHPILPDDLLGSFEKKGLRVAIDDFGTGYSSLARLQNIHADILKLDRSFLRGVPDDLFAASVVSAVIDLARSVGMVPLAEGIETPQQLRFVQERGCELGQGWLFGRPVKGEEFDPALGGLSTGW